MHLLVRAFLFSLVFLPFSTAHASLIGWSFSNVVGGVAGTVSGILEVPDGNGVSATSVVLTSTTNSTFDSLIGFDFVTLPNFRNLFNVSSGEITAAQFGTDFRAGGNTHISLEFNSEKFLDRNSQNLALLTTAGNPFGVCVSNCLQTAVLVGDNTGQTQFAPSFFAVPEPVTGALLALGLLGTGIARRRKMVA
jgi:hypothetical protein